jgi:oligopeptidase B
MRFSSRIAACLCLGIIAAAAAGCNTAVNAPTPAPTPLPATSGVSRVSSPLFDLNTATAPRAAKKPKDVSVHGDTRIDDYGWLRSDEPTKNEELMAYLRAENAYADAVMKPVEGFKDALYKEMLARIKETDESVPYQLRGYWYTSKTEQGKQYPTHVRRKGSASAPDELLLDVNALAQGKKYMSVRGMRVSPNNQLLAYGTNETGGLEATLRVREIATQKDLPLEIKDVAGFVWAADNKTLFYTKQDKAKRPYQVWRHVLGSTQADTLIFEEKDELFWLDLSKTRSDAFILINLGSKDTSEVHVLPAGQPQGKFRVIEPRKKGLEYSVEHRGELFYIVANDTGVNFRLASAPVANPGKAQWKELIAHRKDVLLEDVSLFAGHMVLLERDRGVKKFRVFDLASNQDHYISFDEPSYNISTQGNAEFNTKTLRFDYTSLKTPQSVFDYDMMAKTRELKKRQPVLGDFDNARYTTERISVRAKDGTQVPVSLVYRTGLRKPGTAQPLLLYGYGSYGFSNDANFSSARLSLLDRGVIVALAHIRGGSDLGRAWYDDGKLAKKMNTFTDFIACAEGLIAQGYTSKDKLIAQGGSAGGLLMGAVTNLRPDLFKAIIAEVPFVDVLNTMLDETLPLTVGEFLEWGNPKIKEQYAWMRAYAPYDNLRATAYPAMYVRAGINDNQVAYWEPAKYVAKLRTLKTNADAPLLFHINLDAGHGGASGRYDALKERAQVFAFMFGTWGIGQ